MNCSRVTTDVPIKKLATVVLCGGRSSRMGIDKASADFGGETLLQRVCRITSMVSSPVVAVAASGQILPPIDDKITVVRDARPEEGPLSAFMDALLHLQTMTAEDFDSIMVWACTCDAPFVMPDVIRLLHKRLAVDRSLQAVAVRHAGRDNPFGAIYRSSALEVAQRLVAAGERRASMLLTGCRTEFVESEELREADQQLLSLQNVNTPQDLSSARKMLLKCECEEQRPISRGRK